MYSNIKEKRAKEIASNIIAKAHSANLLADFPMLKKFYVEGENILPLHVMDIINELKKVNTYNNGQVVVRYPYEDTVRLWDYFETFIPQYKIDLLLYVVKCLDATDYENTEQLKTRFSGLKIKAALALNNYKMATL